MFDIFTEMVNARDPDYGNVNDLFIGNEQKECGLRARR